MVEHRLIPAWLACYAAILAAPAMAQEAVTPDSGTQAATPHELFERDSLTDGWFGMAPGLKDRGVVLGATEISEVIGVAAGGTGRGAIFEGRLELDLDLDLDRILGLANTVLHASAYQIHGRGASGFS